MFLFCCVSHSSSLPLSSYLGCIPLLIGLPFLRILLTKVFFLLYVYYAVVFRFFLLFLSLFLFFACVCFHFVSLLCPFLAAVSFAGYFLVCFLLSECPAFFSESVPGLIWFGSVELLTTAGFVADQLMLDKQQQQQQQLMTPIPQKLFVLSAISMNIDQRVWKMVQ